jgi:hypothetical protein
MTSLYIRNECFVTSAGVLTLFKHIKTKLVDMMILILTYLRHACFES